MSTPKKRLWLASTDAILDELDGCHPADRVRTLAMDLAECGDEVRALREEVSYLRQILAQRRPEGKS